MPKANPDTTDSEEQLWDGLTLHHDRSIDRCLGLGLLQPECAAGVVWVDHGGWDSVVEFQ